MFEEERVDAIATRDQLIEPSKSYLRIETALLHDGGREPRVARYGYILYICNIKVYRVGNCDPVSLAFLGRDPSFPHFLPSGFRH